MPTYSHDNWPDLSVIVGIGPEDGDRTSTKVIVQGFGSYATGRLVVEDRAEFEVLGALERVALADILSRIAADLGHGT